MLLRQEPSASEYPVEGGIPRQAQAHLAGCYTAFPRRRGQQTGQLTVAVTPLPPQQPYQRQRVEISQAHKHRVTVMCQACPNLFNSSGSQQKNIFMLLTRKLTSLSAVYGLFLRHGCSTSTRMTPQQSQRERCLGAPLPPPKHSRLPLLPPRSKRQATPRYTP